MALGRLRGSLSLVNQGIEVALHFGLRSLAGLASVAELLQHSVYESQSLRRTPDGFEFTFLNPPLRMGAFQSARLLLNSDEVPAADVLARPPAPAAPMRFDAISRATPLVLPVGERTRFEVRATVDSHGPHRLRLELQSVAIPPRVWFEFSDELREPRTTP